MAEALATNAASPGHLLQLLRDGRPRTRAELSSATGLSRSTVRTRLDMLLHAGLVAEADSGISTGGRPADLFVFNTRARVVLTTEVGATHAVVAVNDLTGAPLAVHKLSLNISDGPDTVLASLVEQWQALLAELEIPVSQVAGVGIGLPGPVEHATGRPANPPIMPGWNGFDVPGRVRADFDVPVLVDNEVNLMALGEHSTAYPGVDHLILVKIATGIGAGLISNYRLHRGTAGAAGDIGHIPGHNSPDVPCRCGNTGCLEAIAGGGAIAALLREKGLHVETNAEIVDIVRSGNVVAGQILRAAGRTIGDVLATCVNMFNPALIVISGSLAQAGELLLAGIRESIYRRSLPLATENLRIVHSQTGDQAGVIGAAVMVIQEILDPSAVDRQLA
ncbi:ROK family transcriptional regulator [Nocardia sp. NPDC049707]|uniref:ROK family transcriptional regulator n=1 Tax=Nocardia sp. NPDC049707 TaxID=3154735 RepID=UPI00344ACC14